jgi:hypothetical protein
LGDSSGASIHRTSPNFDPPSKYQKLDYNGGKMMRNFFVLLSVVALVGCQSAYYSALEKVGVYKRDLLKKKVVAAKEDQEKAGEQFKDALTRLKELYNYDGGDFERSYNKIKSDFDRSKQRADIVKKRVTEVEGVAKDLFLEWEREIAEISSASLQQKSRSQLQITRQKYEALHTSLKRAEMSMYPVLKQFQDQVLFLKHNLNAQAIASLKGEAGLIQDEITKLIEEMNVSIRQADEFIKALP